MRTNWIDMTSGDPDDSDVITQGLGLQQEIACLRQMVESRDPDFLQALDDLAKA
jgi:hypothetical protein